MKKIICYAIFAIILFVAGLSCSFIYSNYFNSNANDNELTFTNGNTTVESLIKEDCKYFDNMAGKIVFYESRVVMPKPFNEADAFVAQEVTNVFQQTIETKNGGFTTNVYFFTHQLNDCSTDIDIHNGAFMTEDRPLDIDTIKVTFDQAFTVARESNYIPSKSRYITLRTPLGSNPCNPQYSIGNSNMGQLWVDAYNGNVTDKAPNMK